MRECGSGSSARGVSLLPLGSALSFLLAACADFRFILDSLLSRPSSLIPHRPRDE